MKAEIPHATHLAKEAILEGAALYLPHSQIILFGSRARGDAECRSDFDIAVNADPRDGKEGIMQFKDYLEHTASIIYSVDVVDLQEASETLKERVASEGILWKN